MPRTARLKGKYCTYHIIQRGNERKSIFLSNRDKERYLDTLFRMKEKYYFDLYVFCLMNNHVHLIIYDNGNDISEIIKSINISYALYFNRVHDRCGHLFQDRFKSELILNDTYLLQASKYIHNNPVKAAMVKKPDDYQWSSYNSYTGKRQEENLINTTKILGMISPDKQLAMKQYQQYIVQEEKLKVMDVDDIEETNAESILTIEEAKKRLQQIAGEKNMSYEKMMSQINTRNEAIRMIREQSNLTLQQISKVFDGISVSRISRIAGRF